MEIRGEIRKKREREQKGRFDRADRGEKIRTYVSQTKRGGAGFLNAVRKGNGKKNGRGTI